MKDNYYYISICSVLTRTECRQ